MDNDCVECRRARGHPSRVVRGFLLGKFMPPHEGHLALCRTAAALCDELTVLVCSRDVEPVPGELRAGIMAQCLPGVRVVWMHRDIPQEPADHPRFWTVWRAAIAEHCPDGVDRVFGSEPYVARLAEELHAEPFIIDQARLAVPVSATAIRSDPAGQWRWIPGPLRPWYQKRLVVLGGESSESTVLASHLAALSGGPCVPADVRLQGSPAARWDLTAPLLQAAADLHAARRRGVACLAGPVLVEDTDAVMLAALARKAAGVPLTAFEDALDLADFYVLLQPPSETDATDGLLYADCLDILVSRSARHVLCAESREQRHARAEQALASLMNEPFQGRWSHKERDRFSNRDNFDGVC